MPIIDLNADVGEERGNDAALLDVVTSANVAAGGHAGGDEVLRSTVEQCARRNVAVGAHPSYPDRANFGRVSIKDEYEVTHLTDVLRHQIRAVAAACSVAGTSLTHVKAHGALYHDATNDDAIAESFIAAVTKVSTEIEVDLYVTGAAGSRLQDVAEASNIRFVAEAFVDRAYNTDGTLVPRSQAGAVHDDLPVAVSQALSIALNGQVDTIDGTVIDLTARTLCVHGDSPEAAAMAGAVRTELIARGVTITPIADVDT
ncbi:MAG: LamB/YcsF family protein [Actinomycetia bacterium]|nr:LamB/YcsF family protein [Actinomycetes bacterium]